MQEEIKKERRIVVLKPCQVAQFGDGVVALSRYSKDRLFCESHVFFSSESTVERDVFRMPNDSGKKMIIKIKKELEDDTADGKTKLLYATEDKEVEMNVLGKSKELIKIDQVLFMLDGWGEYIADAIDYLLIGGVKREQITNK